MNNRERELWILDEVEPDEEDLVMIAKAEQENDGTTVSFKELLEKDNIHLADILA